MPLTRVAICKVQDESQKPYLSKSCHPRTYNICPDKIVNTSGTIRYYEFSLGNVSIFDNSKYKIWCLFIRDFQKSSILLGFLPDNHSLYLCKHCICVFEFLCLRPQDITSSIIVPTQISFSWLPFSLTPW